MADGLTRRQVVHRALALSGAAAMAGILASCSRRDENSIRFANWQDYIGDGLLDQFTETSDLAVALTTYDSNDELGDLLALAGVPRRGNRKPRSFDLVVPSDNLFGRLRDQQRLQPLNVSIVTSELLDNLEPTFRELAFDPGNQRCVPWATGTTGIGYDTTVFAEPPGWDVFANATHAGRLTLLDESREAFAAALYTLGEDPNTTDQRVIDAAEARLAEMLAVSTLNSSTYLDDLTNGSLVAAQAFSTDLLQARESNPNLEFVIPEAGGTRWIDVLCIPEDAPNPDGANQFIAFYLDAEVSAANAMSVLVDTGNRAARPFVSAEVLQDPAIYPPDEVAGRLNFIRDLGDDEQRYTDAWARLRD